MSVDIYLNVVSNGEGGYVPLSVFESAFKDAITHKEMKPDWCYLFIEYPWADGGKK